MLTTTLNLQHSRSSKTIRSFESRGYNPENLKFISEEKFGGQLIKFNRPFGVDYYISLFDGENAYYISAMGGHRVSFLVVEAVVDSRQKVLFQEDGPDFSKFKDLLKDELPKEVFTILEKDGLFGEDNEQRPDPEAAQS